MSANGSLATTAPEGTLVPLKIGDTFEINGHHAVVVGICKVTQGFYPQPIVLATYSQFAIFTGFMRTNIQFIAAKASPEATVKKVLNKINAYPMLNALTRDEIEWRIAKSFLKTGILINFGLSLLLGISIGFSIAVQIFYIRNAHLKEAFDATQDVYEQTQQLFENGFSTYIEVLAASRARFDAEDAYQQSHALLLHYVSLIRL